MSYTVDQNIVLETPHLILRYVKPEDKEAYFNNIYHDKEVLKYFVTKYKETIDELDINKYIQFGLDNNRYYFSIVLKETNEVIGMIIQCSDPSNYFPSSEIGYAIGRKYWNQGYMSEALPKMVEFMKTLGIHKIAVSHFVENVASKKVILKSGFTYEGRHIHDMYYHDKYWDLDYYYILND